MVECSFCHEEMTLNQAKRHPSSLKSHTIECVGKQKGCRFSGRKELVVTHQNDCIFARHELGDISERGTGITRQGNYH